MRFPKIYKKISVEDHVHERLKADREHLQKTIGGGKWSISDTIKEYHKIIKTDNNGEFKKFKIMVR